MKCALVCGAGGFIGSHLVKRLKKDGLWVRGVDLKYPEFSETEADDFLIGDLRDPQLCRHVVDRRFDEVYQLAADMGGAGFVDVHVEVVDVAAGFLHAFDFEYGGELFVDDVRCEGIEQAAEYVVPLAV